MIITNISKRLTRVGLLLMLFLAQSALSSAQVELSIEDFTIQSGEQKEVSLLLNNDKKVAGLQVTIDLPANLVYVPSSVKKTSRITGRGASVQASDATGELVILETDGSIAAGEGAVITFTLEAKAALTEGDHYINLHDIVLASDADENIATTTSKTTKVSVLGIGDCSMYAEKDEIGLVIGEEYQVNILLDNENVTTLAGLSGTLTLPQGVEIVEGADGMFVYSDRTPDPLVFKFQEFDGYTNFLLTSSNNTLITGISGTIFSFIVKADASLALTDEIKLTNLRVANTGGHYKDLDDIVITVTNVKAQQLLEDKAAFETYKTEQAAVAEALAEDGDSEASAALIATAKEDINAAEYDEEKTLDENKEAVDAIVTQLTSDLEAQRAADLLAANKEAFAAEQTAQKEAADALAKDGDSEASAKLITDAKAAIDALTYDEEKTLDENKAAVDAIMKKLTDNLNAQRAAEAGQLPGDLDNSGEIDIDDFNEYVDELLSNDELWEAGDNPELYEKYEKYDVNGDGYVDVADAQALLNLTLGLNIDGTLPSSVRAKHAVVNTLSAAGFNLGNGVTRYVISLDDSREFSAFQMQINGEVLNVVSDNSNLMTKRIDNGMRVLGFADNDALANNNVLTVDVKGCAQFNHISFSTHGACSVAFALNIATGINAVASQDADSHYDLNGRKLQSAQKGVNIVREADGKVRKVLVK